MPKKGLTVLVVKIQPYRSLQEDFRTIQGKVQIDRELEERCSVVDQKYNQMECYLSRYNFIDHCRKTLEQYRPRYRLIEKWRKEIRFQFKIQTLQGIKDVNTILKYPSICSPVWDFAMLPKCGRFHCHISLQWRRYTIFYLTPERIKQMLGIYCVTGVIIKCQNIIDTQLFFRCS